MNTDVRGDQLKKNQAARKFDIKSPLVLHAEALRYYARKRQNQKGMFWMNHPSKTRKETLFWRCSNIMRAERMF